MQLRPPLHGTPFQPVIQITVRLGQHLRHPRQARKGIMPLAKLAPPRKTQAINKGHILYRHKPVIVYCNALQVKT